MCIIQKKRYKLEYVQTFRDENELCRNSRDENNILTNFFNKMLYLYLIGGKRIYKSSPR